MRHTSWIRRVHLGFYALKQKSIGLRLVDYYGQGNVKFEVMTLLRRCYYNTFRTHWQCSSLLVFYLVAFSTKSDIPTPFIPFIVSHCADQFVVLYASVTIWKKFICNRNSGSSTVHRSLPYSQAHTLKYVHTRDVFGFSFWSRRPTIWNPSRPSLIPKVPNRNSLVTF